MSSMLRHSINNGAVGERCISKIQERYCDREIDDQKLESAQWILTSRRFLHIRSGLDYNEDLDALARCSFCEQCEAREEGQVEIHRAKLLRCMEKEQEKTRVIEIGTKRKHTHNTNAASTKLDSYGYMFTPADSTKDTQGLRKPEISKSEPQVRKEQSNIRPDEASRHAEKVKNFETKKASLNERILDLTQQLEQQCQTANSKKDDDLYEKHEQLKRKYATERAQWNARESVLLTKIAELQQRNSQSQQGTQVSRIRYAKELLRMSGAVKVLHDQLSWFLGSRPEEDEEEL